MLHGDHDDAEMSTVDKVEEPIFPNSITEVVGVLPFEFLDVGPEKGIRPQLRIDIAANAMTAKGGWISGFLW